ncbi:MAG: cyclopropane-fatty-acyl-phospholipid synthase family protein [Pseudomonadota bacterium]|nr:cyclopropane-fatty-acyl-phospholipid synthase family protein [Pseudomonadota bacterium]
MLIQELVEDLLGPDLPIGIRAYDGTRMGPPDPPATLVIHSKNALRRIVTRPGELGFARSYVTGEVEIEGDIFDFIALQSRLPQVQLNLRQVWKGLKILGLRNLWPLAPPPEEARIRFGLRHSRGRDARSLSAHYDLPNEFFELILGPSLTYTCAVFESENDTLEQAQANKYELICRKLALGPGKRLLDLGCGWGDMVIHAAKHHGARAVGVTLSKRQAEYAREKIRAQGLDKLAEIRVQDFRDIDHGPYDAVSAIGFFEHVGLGRRSGYIPRVFSLLSSGGRFLNHAISRMPNIKERLSRSGFADRYVFPDGELVEIGKVVSAVHKAGFDIRHVENLRDHYVPTLRRWAANLERHWDRVVALSSLGKARVFRLYLAGSAMRFAWNQLHVHQLLALKSEQGPKAVGMPFRPIWDGSLKTERG